MLNTVPPVDLTIVPRSSRRHLGSVSLRCFLLVGTLALSLVAVVGCSSQTGSTPNSKRVTSSSQQENLAEVRAQLETIPPPSKTRFMSVKTLTSWENPYLTVQDSMLTLHVMLADANTSGLGQGGMLRPVGARRQDLTIRVGELAEALNAVPQSAWPYGRVIAIEEAHNAPASVRPQIRRNIESVMKTLSDLGVVVYEWSEGGASLR